MYRSEKIAQASSLVSPLTRTLILVDRRPILMTSFNLSYLLKALSPNAAALVGRAST